MQLQLRDWTQARGCDREGAGGEGVMGLAVWAPASAGKVGVWGGTAIPATQRG